MKRLIALLVFVGCAAGADNDTTGSSTTSSGSGGGGSCTAGQEESCYGGMEQHAGVGICARGLRHCQLDSATSTWGPCLDWVAPGQETCDSRALDEDCDGSANEQCACREGQTMACGSAEGACEPGVQSCVNGRFGDCRGAVGPSPEGVACNNALDDDCDGDSDCADSDCATACNTNCGNGTCESGENPTSCPCDCSGCTTNNDCGGMTPECCIPCGCNGPALQCVTPSNCCG